MTEHPSLTGGGGVTGHSVVPVVEGWGWALRSLG